jgi:hypothetical protein
MQQWIPITTYPQLTQQTYQQTYNTDCIPHCQYWQLGHLHILQSTSPQDNQSVQQYYREHSFQINQHHIPTTTTPPAAKLFHALWDLQIAMPHLQ